MAPDDPGYAQQWALPKIAWDQAYGQVAVKGAATIAVLDTGIDRSHPDLGAMVSDAVSFVAGGNPDTDLNGHGTALAGIAAAGVNNGTGMAGVAYAGTSLLSVQVLGADGTGTDTNVVAGVRWATDHGANVILMAFTSPDYSDALADAVAYAQSKGAVVVAAVGNHGQATAYPAGLPGVIGVAATDINDNIAGDSNTVSAAVAAPGVGLYTTAPGGKYTSVGGTSSAAAEVAGLAALLVANGKDPGQLLTNTDPVNGAAFGRINVAKALDAHAAPGRSTGGSRGKESGTAPVYTAAQQSFSFQTASGTKVSSSGSMATAMKVFSQGATGTDGLPVSGSKILVSGSGFKTQAGIYIQMQFSLTANSTPPNSQTAGAWGDVTVYGPTGVADGCFTGGTGSFSNCYVIVPSRPADATAPYFMQIKDSGSGNFTINTAQTFGVVTPDLAISPNSATIGVGQSQGFVASGGGVSASAPYTWSTDTPAYGTLSNSGTYSKNLTYLAGSTPGTNTITLTDGDGNTITATIQVVPLQSTTVTAVSGSATYGGTATLTATLKAGSTPLSNKTIAFTYDGNNYTGTTNSSGVATATGVPLGTNSNAGSYAGVVSASFAGDGTYSGSSNSGSLTVSKANATISVTGYNVTYDGNPHTATGSATGIGGTNLNALLDLSQTTHTAVGTYNGDPWTFAGNTNFNADSGTVNSSIAAAGQSGFTLTVPGSITYGSTGTATAGGGQGTGVVTYSAGGSTGCTVDANTGVITVTDASGTCAITATKAADGTYSSVTDGPKSVTLSKANASISVTSYSVTYDGAAHTATGTATGVGGAVLSVLLDLSGTTHTNAGTYNDTWTFAGNNNYKSGSGTVADTITAAGQSGFTLTVPGSITYGSTGTATAGGGQGTGAVTYSAGGSTGCTVNANTGVIRVTDASGTCVITATKAADGTYSSVTDGPKSVTLSKANASISVTGYTVTYDGAAHTATGTATGVGGADLSSLMHLGATSHTNVGSYTDTWTFDGNNNYNSASGNVTDTITAAGQSGFTLTVPGSITYGSSGTATAGGGQGTGVVTYSAGGATGCTVDANTGVITVTDASGTCAITATKAGDGTYGPATDGPKTVALSKANASISVPGYTVTYDGNAHTATGSATGVGGADLSSLLHLGATSHTNVGTYTDTWTFDGNNNYNSATGPVTDKIGKADAPTLTVTGYDVTYDGNPHTATGVATGVKGEDLSNLFTLTGTTHTNAGTYTTDTWTFAGDTNYNSTSGSVTDKIGKADAPTLTVTGYDATYDGNAHTATGTATGVKGENLSSLFTLTGTTHTNAGTYTTDTWTFAGDTNYNSTSGSVTDKIGKADAPTLTVTGYDATYEGNAHTAMGTATGVKGENLSSLFTLIGTTHTNAGTYSDSWTFAGDTNYNSANDTVTDKIAPKTVTITPDSGQSKVHGALDPTLTFTNDGGLTAADFTGALGRAPGEDVGTYAITLGTLSAGSNYTLQFSVTPVTFAIVDTKPTLDPIPDRTDAEGDTVSLTLSGSDVDGDTLTYTVTGLPKGLTLSGNTISGRIEYNTAGTYEVTVTVSDPAGAIDPTHTASQTFTWAVDQTGYGGLTGHVYTDAGNPVPDLGVELLDAGGHAVSSLRTDANGQFLFTHLAVGMYTAVTPGVSNELARGQAIVYTGTVTTLDLMLPGKATLTLVADPAAIVGDGSKTSNLIATLRLRDGTPVEGVTVQFSVAADPHGPKATLSAPSATTNSTGVARVVLTAPALNGIMPLTQQVKVTVHDEAQGIFAQASVTITFLPDSIKGIVTDAAGNPVTDGSATVSVDEDFNGDGVSDYAAATTTDADGRYVILVPRGNWTYHVKITRNIVIGGKPKTITSTQNAPVGALTGLGKEIEANRSVGGKLWVVDQAGGDPQAPNAILPTGAALTGTVLTKDGDPAGLSVTLDADGNFSVKDIPPGDYQIRFQVTAKDKNNQPVVLAGLKLNISVAQNGQAALQTGLIDPFGTVTDAVTHHPIPNADVLLVWAATGQKVDLPLLNFQPNNNKNSQSTTAAGAYGWMVYPDSDYKIVATAPGYQTFTSGVIHVAQDIVKYDFAMAPLPPAPAPAPAPAAPTGLTATPGNAQVTLTWNPVPGAQHYTLKRATQPGGPYTEIAANLTGTTYVDQPLTNGTTYYYVVTVTTASGTSGNSNEAAATPTAPAPTPTPTPQPVTPPILPKPERPAAGAHQRYILGYPDGTFKPEQTITRAEVATILVRILQLPTPTTRTPFPDVDSTAWYAANVAAVAGKGIMQGDPNGTFRPDAPITRAEVAAVAVRLRGLKPGAGQSAFLDSDGHWAEGYLNTAKLEGLITGYPDGTFHPQSDVTRAEFVTLVNRLLNRGPLLGRSARWPDVPAGHWAYGEVEEASTSHHFEATSDQKEQWIQDIDQ